MTVLELEWGHQPRKSVQLLELQMALQLDSSLDKVLACQASK